MSGRGKGGKGLGKGGAKRHRKVLRDNIQVDFGLFDWLTCFRLFLTLFRSRASPSPPSGAWPGGEASRGSPASSTRRPGASSRSSSRTSSATPSLTPSTPRGRLSPLWTWCTLSRGRDAPSTDSAAKRF